MCLTILFAISFTTLLKNFALGVLALGVVIFVHELGHFIVAKLCGVRCDKFYVGFDPPLPFGLPSALFKKKIGETEYGIGTIPFGGYVKMLGQDDNPANAAREAERIRLASEKTTGLIDAEDDYQIDPRSYPAKPVWQRLMIISAGVVMNLIFAVIFGAVAYFTGMLYTPCVIGEPSPGLSGWQVGLQPGDRVLQVGRDGKFSEHLRFQNDLATQVMMLDVDSTVDILVRRHGQSEPEWLPVQLRSPDPETEDRPYIGIAPIDKLALYSSADAKFSMTATSKLSQPLQEDDLVVAVNGQPVGNYVDFSRVLANRFDESITLSIERPETKSSARETFDVEVAANPMRWVGIGAKIGPVVSVQRDSPAASAGFQEGDLLKTVDGTPIYDGIVVPYQLDRLAGQRVEIVVDRNGTEVTLSPTLRESGITRLGPPSLAGLLAAESLGIAFGVTNHVAYVAPNSPAAENGIQAGDTVELVKFIPAENVKADEEEILKVDFFSNKYDLKQHPHLWPMVQTKMQHCLPDTTMEVTYERNGTKVVTTLVAVQSKEWNVQYRGLRFLPESEIHRVDDVRSAIALGFRETKEGLDQVVTILKRLVTGKVSPKAFAGPLSIAVYAGHEASQSISRLLAFLTMLSANIAVLNFLPIPVLDGGHAVFLIYEAIFRKPLDERLAYGLTVVGFCFVVGLLFLVLGLDITRFGQLLFPQ